MLSKEKKEIWMLMMFPVSESVWAEAIYMYICQDYMYQMYVPQTKHIETLEKILCILQYRSIGDEKGTFYDFKTHIDYEKQEARVTYISDILRVQPINKITYGCSFGKSQGIDLQYLDRFKQKVIQYKNKSEQEINAEFEYVLKNKNLNSKYFTKDKYVNKMSRGRYRSFTREIKHPFLSFIKTMVFGMLSYCFVLLLLVSILCYLGFTLANQTGGIDARDFGIYIERSAYVIKGSFIFLPFLVAWLLWTIRWRKPTTFELEHHYVEE